MNIAYVGSFDPPHKGHFDIIERGSKLGKLHIGIALDNDKKAYLDIEKRSVILYKWVKEKGLNVDVHIYSGPTIDFLKKIKANCILRSLRNGTDFEYEFPYATMNKEYGYDTIFLFAKPEYSHISSSLVRKIIGLGLSTEKLI